MAQHRSKENFEKRKLNQKGFLGRIFSNSHNVTPAKAAGAKNRGVAAQNKRNQSIRESQREQAEAIWLQQRKFREEQRRKQLNRKPTAWEIAYIAQEKQRLKELKKLLKERDKRIAARTKSRQKATAAAAKYKQRKLRNAPIKTNQPQSVFTSSAQPDAGNESRRK